jgi:single-strand DNA-binding protein
MHSGSLGSGSARFPVPRETPGQKKENRIMYQNRATLIGFLGKDAEVKTTRKQASYTVFSLATKRSWKDRTTGERFAETTWHRCIVWGKLGEFAATLTKGAHVQIEGEIRTREYTQKTGGKKPVEVKKSITEIRVFAINKLDRPAKGEAEGAAA